MKNRPARLLSCLWFVPVVLFGLGHATSSAFAQEKTAKTPVKKDRGVICVSLLTLENPFFKVIGDNITEQAKKHGYTTVVLSADRDPVKQSAHVREFIVKKAAAIVLSPCESRTIVPAVQEANKADIPVFTVDIPCKEEGAKIKCQIATDNYSGGQEAGKAMIEALNHAGGQVAILHFQQAESCRLRVEGFRQVVEQWNKNAIKKLEIVAELDGGGLKEQGFKATEDLMQAHPEVIGLFAINDPSALGARAALEKAGKAERVKIVGFDGQPEGKLAIKEGKIYADPIQFPDQMGIEIVKAIVANSKGEDFPAEKLIPTKLYRKVDAQLDSELK